jgi:hypothetical protein
LTSPKLPRTVIIPRCFAENSTCVCIGSNFQVPIHASSDLIAQATYHPLLTHCLIDRTVMVAEPERLRQLDPAILP